MENVHNAIAWYQKKIGSYDKQLWEQSVEKKLQKQPPFVLHNAPRKKVRLKTEYIDVDLIRGSTFTKTKPQVPWVYITRKAISRVLFFPFYYNWWVTQTSKQLYGLLLVLYVLQVVTIFVYVRNFDHSIMEDELSFTEVILPTILMFLLCLIHSQTVLAHINHKPPKRTKSISGVTRKPRPKKTSRKGRSSGNNSTCPEDGANTDSTKPSGRRSSSPRPVPGQKESHSSNSAPNNAALPQSKQEAAAPSIDMEKSLLSRSVSDYDLKPATSSSQSDVQASASLPTHHQNHHHHHQEQNHQQHHHHYHHYHPHSESVKNDSRSAAAQHYDKPGGCTEHSTEKNVKKELYKSVWGDGTDSVQKSGCSYNLLDNLPNLLTVEKVCCDVSTQNDAPEDLFEDRKGQEKLGTDNTDVVSSASVGSGRKRNDSVCLKVISRENVHDDTDEAENEVKNSSDSAGSEKTQALNIAENVHKSDIHKVDCPNSDHEIQPIVSNLNENIEQGHSVSEDSEKHMPSSVNAACGGASSDIPKSGRRQQFLSQSAKRWPHCANCASARELAARGQRRRSSGVDAGSNQAELENGRGEEEMLQYDTQDSCDSGINESPSMLNNHGHSHSCEHGWSLDDDHLINTADGADAVDNASPVSGASCSIVRCSDCGHEKDILSHHTELADHRADPHYCTSMTMKTLVNQDVSPTCSDSSSTDPSTYRECVSQTNTPTNTASVSSQHDREHKNEAQDDNQSPVSPVPQILVRPPSVRHDKQILQEAVRHPLPSSSVSPSPSSVVERQSSATGGALSESSSHLQCFSEQFVQEILNEETIREMSYTSLLVHSDLENSSSSISHLSTTSAMSSTSTASSSCKMSDIDHIPLSTPSSVALSSATSVEDQKHKKSADQDPQNSTVRRGSSDKNRVAKLLDEEKLNPLDESLDQINMSDGERPSDDVSNYNASDSDADSDGPLHEDLRNRCEEKWKRLRFQEQVSSEGSAVSKASLTPGTSSVKSGTTSAGGGARSVVGILTRKPSPLKDLALGRKTSSNTAVTNSSGSDQEQGESRNQLRRRRRTSGTPEESCRGRSVPTSLGIRSESKPRHLSSSENETGGGQTPEGSNKATMSSEEWEDRMQSDETTSSAYSSNSEVDSDEKVEEEEEKTEYTTSTLHVINLLQPQSGSPTSSGNVTQPDKVSCVIWEGNECKKVDLTALDIGWAIIDKVDSLPESSDYFFIGLLFSFLLSLVPLVFRAYANKEVPSFEDLLSWSWYFAKLCEIPALLAQTYSWRQYLVMVNGILQRFFLSLIFFFLLSVADRTFKQRLLYAKHFSYLTSSRRARKFSMPHFRLNKVRNIKIWLSLRSYLKRRGPQRSVDVIVSACFLCAICTVCLISLQMLKDTESYLDYLCNWELLVWCVALAVFLMRFMTVGLKINKKYRNLSVLITEQINLYLQMEQKPHKKEELILANNVLRLAEDLLKELESPFKISGFSANPLIYNIMRVVVLSAFSAVLTEVLGFKLKLHKIKLKG